MSRSQLWTSVAWVPAFMGSMLYQAGDADATRVSFQFRVSDAPTIARVRLTRRGQTASAARFRPQRSRLRLCLDKPDRLENGMRRIPVLIVAAGLAASAVGRADAIRLRRVEERAADARSENKNIRDDHRAEHLLSRAAHSRFPSTASCRRTFNSIRFLPRRNNWRPNFAVSATLSSKSWLPSLIRGPARWKSCSRGGGSHSLVCYSPASGFRYDRSLHDKRGLAFVLSQSLLLHCASGRTSGRRMTNQMTHRPASPA